MFHPSTWSPECMSQARPLEPQATINLSSFKLFPQAREVLSLSTRCEYLLPALSQTRPPFEPLLNTDYGASFKHGDVRQAALLTLNWDLNPLFALEWSLPLKSLPTWNHHRFFSPSPDTHLPFHIYCRYPIPNKHILSLHGPVSERHSESNLDIVLL